MNASNAAQFLPFVEALSQGAVIQTRVNFAQPWNDMEDLIFYNEPVHYRIKPVPREWEIGIHNAMEEEGHDIPCCISHAGKKLLNCSQTVIRVREILD